MGLAQSSFSNKFFICSPLVNAFQAGAVWYLRMGVLSGASNGLRFFGRFRSCAIAERSDELLVPKVFGYLA